jgi:hypothetical protein
MGGLVKPEEVGIQYSMLIMSSSHHFSDRMNLLSLTTSMRFVKYLFLSQFYLTFSKLIITQEFARSGRRGYGDGKSIPLDVRVVLLTTTVLRFDGWFSHRTSSCLELWEPRN